MPRVGNAAVFVAVEAKGLITIAERQCRSAQIAGLARAS
jgi:hypothetical protein